MDTERCGLDVYSLFYSSAQLFIPGFIAFFIMSILQEVLVAGKERTLPTSSEVFGSSWPLALQNKFTIILSCPYQLHKRIFGY